MQKILIDNLIVPEESKAQFLERLDRVQSFLKAQPGFVEGFLYEKKDEESRYNYVTLAVWASEEAFENASKALAAEYKKWGYDRQETRIKLRIQSERGIYERLAY